MTILIPCRDARPSEIPAGAARLAKAAETAGWISRTTFAKADVDDRVIESIVVRLRRPPIAAVGAWHNNKFALGYIGSAFTSPRKVGARDLAKFVKGGTS
jgi:hypothetical protein